MRVGSDIARGLMEELGVYRASNVAATDSGMYRASSVAVSGGCGLDGSSVNVAESTFLCLVSLMHHIRGTPFMLT